MVRLKAVTRDVQTFEDMFFNSTMVRLKEVNERKYTRLPLFQFHYGTIKSIEHYYITRYSIIIFNSTMVRLKVPLDKGLCVCVRIFNSTMVRLKVPMQALASSITTFQFHYGTIKSVVGDAGSGDADSFQFHYGTIKSRLLCSHNR